MFKKFSAIFMLFVLISLYAEEKVNYEQFDREKYSKVSYMYDEIKDKNSKINPLKTQLFLEKINIILKYDSENYYAVQLRSNIYQFLGSTTFDDDALRMANDIEKNNLLKSSGEVKLFECRVKKQHNFPKEMLDLCYQYAIGVFKENNNSDKNIDYIIANILANTPEADGLLKQYLHENKHNKYTLGMLQIILEIDLELGREFTKQYFPEEL